ncbi:beta strand repeat-containing protein [Lacipirellula limnantheis]|uniref:Extracellular serine protease n=1 Tax=Lacipirellula limnantheis TaxID=2528024 RepID=A0A517TY56_9BACT|nr:choice-of-anchor R domain-containing protein [Lacipirellula limnantheis]QDT73299.1 Extracellular serine protease precursor [Lacipirellula limnantheis]
MTTNQTRRALRFVTSAAALLIGIMVPGVASAQFDTSWTNPTIGNWSIESNWSGGVPDEFDDVDIANGGIANVASPGAVYADLTVGGITGPAFAGGNGSLLVSNGGVLSHSIYRNVSVGGNGFVGNVTVAGPGSQFLANGYLLAAGTLTVENGGLLSSVSGESGNAPGDVASTTVTGLGSRWNIPASTPATATLQVGYAGSASLTVANGGAVNNGASAVLGLLAGSSGTATVTGLGSAWNNVGYLQVGSPFNGGAGTVNVTNQGVVRAGSLRVSQFGVVNVNNGSSSVAGLVLQGMPAAMPTGGSYGALRIGDASDGRMTATGGAHVRTASTAIGVAAGRTGAAVISDPGSTWTNVDDIFVGSAGAGALEIRNGATVSNFRAHVGFNGNASGSVLVTDPGSSWTGGGSFFIGNGGSGMLQVLNGATATTAGNSYLGFSTFSQGSATVGGMGSTWTTANTLAIGGNLTDAGGPFASTLRIENGGRVNANETILYNTGVLELNNIATLNSPLLSKGGVIRTYGNTSHADNVTLDAGGLSITTGAVDTTAVFSGVLSGPGALTKSGLGPTGALRLTGANTYAGLTTIKTGALLVDGSVTGATQVNAGGTLGGSGVVGTVDVQSGGAVAPGSSVGTLTTGDMILRGGGMYALELGSEGVGVAGTDWDSLAVNGTLDFSSLSPANRCTLSLKTLGASGAAGSLTTWQSDVDHTWSNIMTASAGYGRDFDESHFAIDVSGFQNPVQGKFHLLDNGGGIDLFYDAYEVAEGVLLTNLDEPVRGATPIGNNPNPLDPPEGPGAPWYWGAQQFINDGATHTLTAIKARVGGGSTAPAPQVVAELRADDGGTIGALLTTFTAPDMTGDLEVREFVPDSLVTLDPSAKYWFTLGSANPGEGTFFWQYANSNVWGGAGAFANYADSAESGSPWTYRGVDFPYFLEVDVATASGDFNGDNQVDGEDLAAWAMGFGQFDGVGAPAGLADGDANGDLIVDGGDFLVWQQQLGGGLQAIAANAPVPEPATSLLLISAVVGIRHRSGPKSRILVDE